MEMSQCNYIAILYKQKCLFSKMEKRRVRQVPSGSWHQWGECRERRWKGEYVENIMYSCMKMEKMRPVETIPGMGGGRIGEMMEG
jgi:hypothetical protein